MPPKVDPHVGDFCARVVSGSEPKYVSVIPRAHCPPNECFENVRLLVEREGGRCVYGWSIWEWPNVMIEAEFHCVWEFEPGRMNDVTSRTDGERTILFLPDPNLTYEGFQVDNVRFALRDDPLIKEFIGLAEKKHEIFNRGENKFKNDEIKVDRYELEPVLLRLAEVVKLIQKQKKRG